MISQAYIDKVKNLVKKLEEAEELAKSIQIRGAGQIYYGMKKLADDITEVRKNADRFVVEFLV